MKATFLLTLLYTAISFAQSGMTIKRYSLEEGTKKIDELMREIKETSQKLNLKNNNINDLFGEIQNPVDSKNRALGYCTTGVYPLAKRVDFEVPFKIGHKNSCSKGAKKLAAKIEEANIKFIRPILANAMLVRDIAVDLLKNQSKPLEENFRLHFYLSRLTNMINAPEKFRTGNQEYTFNARQAIDLLEYAHMSLAGENYLQLRSKISKVNVALNALQYFAINLNIERLNEF